VYELDELGGDVPAGLVLTVNGNTCRMMGTEDVPIRCTALQGSVGEQVACRIYMHRPSPCRAFAEGSDACQRARHAHGLPPV
jgi:Fe-S-cluster containining protein